VVAVDVVALIARAEVRNRWRALLGLAALVAASVAVVTACSAGALRGATALDRLGEDTLPTTFAALPNAGANVDWDAVRALPGVEAVTAFAVTNAGTEGLDPPGAVTFPPADAEVFHSIERVRVLDGRIPDPTRADEVAVTPFFVDFYGLGVGDTVTLRLATPEQIDAFDEGEPNGPKVVAEIVGVVRSVWFSEEAGKAGGTIIPSPGLFEQYRDNIVGFADSANVNALVRLDDPDRIAEVADEIAAIVGMEQIDVFDIVEAVKTGNDLLRFEARALLVFALAVAVASVFLVGQSISRYVASTLGDAATLRALGATTSQIRIRATAGPGVAALVGIVAGLVAAAYASRWFPVGSARRAEPDVGFDVDVRVFVAAALGMAVLVAGSCAWAFRSAMAPETSGAMARRLESATAGLPFVVSTAVRLLVGPRRIGSVRPAFVGAIVGVTGVAAALTFASGISDATDGFDAYGQTYDAHAFFGAGGTIIPDALASYDDPPAVLAAVAAAPTVTGAVAARNDVATIGGEPLSLFTFSPIGEGIDTVLFAGRMPATESEIVVGPDFAERAGIEVGDAVAVEGADGAVDFTITGIGLAPAGPHNAYAGGGWVTDAGYDRLFEGFKFYFGFVAVAPGADLDSVIATFGDQGIGLAPGPVIEPTEPADLRAIERLPILVAAFVALLAVGATAHVLSSTARSQRRAYAVLFALGITRWNTRGVIAVQGLIIAVVGLVIGMPLGYVIGRGLWRAVAADTPVLFVEPLDVPSLSLTTVAAVALALCVAAWPAHRTTSAPLAQVLRSE
jgi:ABC-type lipoprotein release transport system permease subunit